MLDFHGLLVLMVVIWTAGKIFRSWKLPVVFGELLGGILVGPAVLNLVHDGPVIEVIAELGVFFLMLHAGLETDFKALMKASIQSFPMALIGFVFAMLGGTWLGVRLGYDVQVGMFIGLAMAITSVDLVARLVRDCNIANTAIARICIAGSIFNDILGLILFSVLLNLHQTGSISVIETSLFTGKIVLFFAAVLIGGHLLSPWLHRVIYFGNKGFTLTLILALLLGTVAEFIGLHMVIGAFLTGLFISTETIDTRTFEKIEDRVYALSYSFFGPVFFASLAFSISFGVLQTHFFQIIACFVIAFISKWFGTFVMGCANSYSYRTSILAGNIMNTRGAVSLIIISIGLQQNMINETIFSILVLMTIVTAIAGISLVAMQTKLER